MNTINHNGCLIVPLTKGKVAIVDEIDSWCLGLKWYAYFSWNWYAARTPHRVNGVDKPKIRLHRQILIAATGYDQPGMQVDHKNGETLDNRRCNLRWASASDNSRNRGLTRDNKSGFTGVIWNKQKKKWQAYINDGSRIRHLGYFIDIEKAAAARRKAEIEFHAEFSAMLSRH